MEYPEHGSLSKIIDNVHVRQVPMSAIKFTIAEIVLGLQYMHEINICNRDLKPENILYDGDYNVKICDFGEAKMFN